METPFRAVNFVTHDIVTRDALDQMHANLQWVKDNTPTGRFIMGNGRPNDVRTVLIAGRSRIKKRPKSDDATVSVKFRGNTFAASCRPHVTTGVVADYQNKIFCVVHGPKKTNTPNANGFEISVNIDAGREKRDKIKKDFWVHWHAFGYREDRRNG